MLICSSISPKYVSLVCTGLTTHIVQCTQIFTTEEGQPIQTYIYYIHVYMCRASGPALLREQQNSCGE